MEERPLIIDLGTPEGPFLMEFFNRIFKYHDAWFAEQLDKLYKECEHGNDDHRAWLKNKFEEFKVKVLSSQTCDCNDPNCACK